MVFLLVGIVWRSLETCLFHRAEWLVPNSWQSQHTLSASCWRFLLTENLSGERGRCWKGMGRRRGKMFSKEDWDWQEDASCSEIWRWCHIWSSWRCFLYLEAYRFERSARLEQGCLMQCHASTWLYRELVIYMILSLFCLHWDLAPLRWAPQRRARGLWFGSIFRAQQQTFKRNKPLEGIYTFSQPYRKPVHNWKTVSEPFTAEIIRYWSSDPAA